MPEKFQAGKVGVSDFAKNRHIKNSRFTHFENITWNEVTKITEQNLKNAQPGYRDGVILVPISPENFFTGLVKRTPDIKTVEKFEARREGEEPYPFRYGIGDKQACKFVNIILYRWDVLEEDNDRSTDKEWEIISINGRVTENEAPIPPMTMARNYLHLTGGTKAEYSAKEFAESILFWSKYIMIMPEENL